MESLRQAVRGKMGQETRVGWNSLEEVSKLDRISSNGHFVTSVKDDIWVIVMVHRDVIIVKKLAIYLEIVRTVVIVASLVT